MASLDGLTKDIAERFDLGLKAPALVQEVLGLISPQPENFGVFLAKVRPPALKKRQPHGSAALTHGAYGARGKTGAGRQTYQNYRCKCRRNGRLANKILGYAIPKSSVIWQPKANFQAHF